MSSEIRSVDRWAVVRLRQRFMGFIVALVAGLVAAGTLSPALAQQRVAKCQACAAEAAIVNALGARMPGLRQALDQATAAVQAAVATHQQASAAEDNVRTGIAIGAPMPTNALATAKAATTAANVARLKAIEQYRVAMTAFTKALDDLARATLLLNDCEARLCPAPSAPLPPVAMRPQAFAPVAVPPGMTVARRDAACVLCAEFAARRNALADLVNAGEAQMQQIRDGLAQNRKWVADIQSRRRGAKAERAQWEELAKGGTPVNEDLFALIDQRLRDYDRDEEDLDRDTEHLTAELKAEGARQEWRYGAFRESERQLLECERLMCVRPQADAAPVTSPAPVQTAPPAPPGQGGPPRTATPAPGAAPPPPAPPPTRTPTQTPGDRRTSQAEVQIFGGFAFQNTGLSQTGADTFFGAPLIDQRSSNAAQSGMPAIGVFGRVYPFKTDDAAEPTPRVFVTAGALFTPGSARGFGATGINTVPLGDVYTEYSRTFILPVMAGVRLPFAVGSTTVNLDLMGGFAIGHETLRVTLRGEGGAPGSTGSAESSGLFIDPIVGVGVSTTIAVIDGLGPVSVGAMGLAMIGTGSRSVRVGSPGFATQGYTGEARRIVTFYGGITVTLGVF